MPGQFAQKIIAFLEKEMDSSSSGEERKNRLKAINFFKESRGECHGLAILQAYGRRIEDEDQDETPKKGTGADDAKFFNQTKETLLSWNEESPLDPQQCSDIERLIGNIMLYQRADLHGVGTEMFKSIIFSGQLTQDPSKVLQDTARGDLIKSFDYNNNDQGIIATKKMIQSRLAEIVKPRSIVLIHSSSDKSGHTNAIYQNRNGQIYLFNNEEEIVANSIEELAENLWKVTNPMDFRGPMAGFSVSDLISRNISQIQTYRFENDPTYSYPENLSITASELKSAILKYNGAMAKAFVSSADDHVVSQLYQDPSLEDENIKTLLLSKDFFSKKCYDPILALPPVVMSKKMLADRLAALDKEEIGSILLTYEIDGPRRKRLSICRGYYREDEKPLTLMGVSDEDYGFDNLGDLVDTVWEASAPSNFRKWNTFQPSERFVRKCGIYVFDEIKNERARSVCSGESLSIKAEELENFFKENPYLKEAFETNSLAFHRDELFSSFVKQFPESEEHKTSGNIEVGARLNSTEKFIPEAITQEEESPRPVVANTRRSLVARLCDSINPFKRNGSNQNR